MNHSKAIRDKIPEIIEKSGHSYNIRTLNDEEFLLEIRKKLSEEVTEYNDSYEITELADVIEVVYRIAQLQGISKEELEKIRIKKLQDRGGFDKNLFLIDTSES